MNQTHSQTTRVSITSQHVEDHLDSIIVQLARVIGVENQCPVDEAMNVVKKKIAARLLDFVDDDTKNKMNECVTGIRSKRMKKAATLYETQAHEVLTALFDMEA